MVPKRRRWLTALGLFLAGVAGGVLAYLLARRARRERAAPDRASVAELSARLQREAALRQRRARRRPRRLRWPWGRRRRAVADLSPPSQEGQEVATVPEESADDQKMATRGDDAASLGLRGGRPDDAAPCEPAPTSGGGASHDREDPLVGA